MSLAPLLAAPLPIVLHAFAAIGAFVIGLLQILGPKGTLPHRALGYLWSALMMVVAASSFFIHEIGMWNGFSLIHLLSIWVLLMVPLAVHAARKGSIRRHKITMVSVFLGGLVVAGLFTFVPGRIMHEVAFGSAPKPAATAPAAVPQR